MVSATTSKLIVSFFIILTLVSCECANNVNTEKEKNPVEFSQLNVVSDKSVKVLYNNIEMFNIKEFHETSLHQKYGSGSSFLGIIEGDNTLYQSIVDLESDSFYSLFLISKNERLTAIIAEDHVEDFAIIRIINNTNRKVFVDADSIQNGSFLEVPFKGEIMKIEYADEEINVDGDLKSGRIYNYILNEANYKISISIP